MSITSIMFESQNCTSIESCRAMEYVHNYMDENCMSETEKAMEAIFVDFEDDSIVFSF